MLPLKAPELEPRHRMQFNVITKIPFFLAGEDLTLRKGCSHCQQDLCVGWVTFPENFKGKERGEKKEETKKERRTSRRKTMKKLWSSYVSWQINSCWLFNA